VNHPNDVRDFLVSRRAKVTPEQAGLPAGHNRRVPGLRRGEVAALAGLSVEYYSKIERGAIDGASEQVLEAIARALQLDEAEREHLTFLDPAGEPFYHDWDSAADICVAILRTEAGRNPHDRQLHDLVGELSTRSVDFRTRWGNHNVRHHGSGTKRFNHPVVGELTLAFEGREMAADPGLTLTIYAAEPGSATAERLQILGSWAASNEDNDATRHVPENITSDDA